MSSVLQTVYHTLINNNNNNNNRASSMSCLKTMTTTSWEVIGTMTNAVRITYHRGMKFRWRCARVRVLGCVGVVRECVGRVVV